uniref:Erythrocyte membrane protein band 4.1-like 3a n=1 Tax=Oncorhynchus kisutch TaxID=8019 RepID=A0A8C7GGK4_ONCKI
MTTEPNSESSADQQEVSAAPPLEADSFPPAAAHSTPVRKEQNGDERAEGGVVPQGNQLEPSQAEEDRTSYRSSTSKLSRSPGGGRSVRSARNMQCKVTLLDGSAYTCMVEKRERGHVLFDKVCEQLNLLEKDYFGITFRDIENQKNWLDQSKEMKKQIRGAAWNFSFNVKFYPPDPAQLSEDITRYYLCLQLRDDVVSGRLPCSFATHTVLGSYTVQSELGDYDLEESGTDYVNEFRFAPNQTKELEEKVMDLHKNYKGMTPADAEMHFLENVKKLSMYGVDLHHAKDSEGVEIMLGVCSSGLLIYRDRLRINRFAWPKVLKISYKRNNFYIKIRPGEFEQFESTIGFKLPNHRAAKRLWKVCVEHHTFFRLVSPETPPKKFLNLGSKFRYSGRTQAQTRRASSQIVRPAPRFERSTSKRYIMSRSLDGEMGSDLYGRAKGIAMSDLITTVTPEKRVEERKAEEEVEVKVEITSLPAPQDTVGTPEELLKHTTNISELKRSFLETGADSAGLTEWEKRLSSSPLRSPRLDEAPMIEPLELDEVPGEISFSAPFSFLPLPLYPFLSLSLSLSHFLHPCLYFSQSLSISLYFSVSISLSLSLPLSPSLSLFLSLFLPLALSVSIPLALTLSFSISLSLSLSLSIPLSQLSVLEAPEVLTFNRADVVDVTQQVPVIHTEMKTVTYQSLETVKGGISETRIEKRIVISGDADIDHDEALAQAIKEAKKQHPDMSVTKVVVHKETEITPEEGEE